MDRRRLLSLLPLLPAVLLAKDRDKGKGKGKGKGHEDRDDDRGDVRHFRHEDYVVVQRYYAGPRDLPPGLRKKYYRTGKLPPGWEKRFRPFPTALIQRLPPPPPNCDRGY